MAENAIQPENVAKKGTIILAWVVEAIWRSISKRELKAKEEGVE